MYQLDVLNAKFLHAVKYFNLYNNNPELNSRCEKAKLLYTKLRSNSCVFVANAINNSNDWFNVKLAINTAVVSLQEPIRNIMDLAAEACVCSKQKCNFNNILQSKLFLAFLPLIMSVCLNINYLTIPFYRHLEKIEIPKSKITTNKQ